MIPRRCVECDECFKTTPDSGMTPFICVYYCPAIKQLETELAENDIPKDCPLIQEKEKQHGN